LIFISALFWEWSICWWIAGGSTGQLQGTSGSELQPAADLSGSYINRSYSDFLPQQT
jgi:hypothetical protein